MVNVFGQLPQQIAAFSQPQEPSAADPQPQEPVEAQSLLPETRRGLGRDMLATLDRIRGEADTPKINPLLATSIMGSAILQNKGTDQRAAAKAAEADKNVEVTLKGDGTTTIKGLPANDFLKDAAAQKAGTLAGVYSVIERFGIAPKTKPDDPVFDDDVTEEELYKVGVEQRGWSPSQSRRYARKAMQNPEVKNRALQWMRDNYAKDVLGRHSTVSGIVGNAEQERVQTRLEASEQRRNFEQFLSNDLVNLGTEDDAVSVARERITSSGQKWNDSMEKEVRSAYKGQRSKAVAQHATAVNTRINSIKDEDVRGYGPDQAEDFVANVEAEFGGLTEAQRVRFRKRFNGLQQEIATQRRREDRAEEGLRLRHDRATEDKPAKIPAWQASSLTIDSLVATIGDPLVEQGSARFAVNSRIGRLEADYRANVEKHNEVSAEHERTVRRIAELTKRVGDDQYAKGRDEIDQLERKKIDLEAKAFGLSQANKRIEPDVAKLRGALTGGSQQQTQKYAPQLENGIAAYMQAKGYGPDKRQAAIDELKAAGKLPK